MKFNSDEHLLLNKALEICIMIIVVRAVSYESNNCYPQIFLDKCSYKF